MKRQKAVIKKSQNIYGVVVYWFTVASALICITGPMLAVFSPEKNILNPHLLFSAIWEGRNAAEIWTYAGDGFPGSHFYLRGFSGGDAFTQFGLVLGSTAAMWALIAVAVEYARRRSYGYAAACLFLCGMIIFAMAGVINLK